MLRQHMEVSVYGTSKWSVTPQNLSSLTLVISQGKCWCVYVLYVCVYVYMCIYFSLNLEKLVVVSFLHISTGLCSNDELRINQPGNFTDSKVVLLKSTVLLKKRKRAVSPLASMLINCSQFTFWQGEKRRQENGQIGRASCRARV